jgi:hypothetical protein
VRFAAEKRWTGRPVVYSGCRGSGGRGGEDKVIVAVAVAVAVVVAVIK